MRQNGACYIRVSTDDQTEFSPDAQLKAIKDYAKKNDIILTGQHVYIDQGISGKKAEKRPAFMRMIAAAKAKPRAFDVILVHKFDRFARSREDSVVYKSLLRKEAGIKVISVTESIEDDKFSLILEAMLEAMAEYYSLNLADEVKKGMTEKAERGGLQNGAPFGYRAVNNSLEIVPEEADFVRFVFKKFADGEMNMLELAKYANIMGIRTHKGSLFENRTIDYIIHNPVYIGKLRWTPTGKTKRNFNNPDTIIKDARHGAIIDAELWEKAQQASRRLKELYQKGQHRAAPIKSWSNGLVKCGGCGRSLVAGARGYYQCNGYAKGSCKVSHCISAAALERLALGRLKNDFKGEIEIKIAPKSGDTDKAKEYEFLRDRLEKIKLREQRIKEAYQGGIDTKEEYGENKKKLDEERAFVISELEKLDLPLGEPDAGGGSVIKRIGSVYELLSDGEIPADVKYKAAHFLINRIIYSKNDETLSIEYK